MPPNLACPCPCLLGNRGSEPDGGGCRGGILLLDLGGGVGRARPISSSGLNW